MPYYPPPGGGSSSSAGLMGTGNFLVSWSSDPLLSNEKVLTAGANITIATDATTITIAANTGGASNSAGLMGTGNFLVTWSSDPLLTNEKILTAGSSASIHTDATAIYFNAITSIFAGSGGLASTGGFYAVWSSDPLLSNEKIILAGSSVTIHTDATGIYINATTSASASSGGLAGTGWYYIVGSNASGLPFSKVITAGSSVTTHTDATSFYINATTGASASSAGLAGTGVYYLGTSANSTWPNWLVIQPGSSVTHHITGTNYYINAITGAGASSGGLAGTGSFYAVWSSDPLLSNEKVITAGSSVTLHTDASAIYINATTSIGGASGTSSGAIDLWLLPQQAKLYSNTSSARIDAGTAVWRLLYSATTAQYGIWQFPLSRNYGTSPFVRLLWGMDSTVAVARSCTWIITQWGFTPFQTSPRYYIDTYGGANSVSVAVSAGYSSGTLQSMTIPLTTIVSMNANNLIKIRIQGSGSPGNLELVGATFSYTGT